MSKGLCVLLLAALMVAPIVFVFSVNLVVAATVPPSIISSDTTWTPANSPYNLSGPMLVASGATLTIQSGTTVNIGTYYIQVNGTLSAVGTSINPININGATGNAGQIQFTAACTSWNPQTGTGCTIQNAIISQTMISISNSSIKITDNTINDAADMTHSNSAIQTNGAGASIISNNQFNSCGLDIGDSSAVSNNVIQGGMGIFGGSPVITGNSISGGSSYFYIGRDWDRDYDVIAVESACSPTISNNNITGTNAGITFDTGTSYLNAQFTGNIIYGCTTGVLGGVAGTIISNNIISGSSNYGLSVGNAAVKNNLIINNAVGIKTGSADIENNTIVNSQTAIVLDTATSPIITWNNIENSNQYNLKLSNTATNINAPNNWWGTTDQQAISQSIYDQKNDFNLGTVTFMPILTTANPSAPAATGFQPTPSPSPTLTPSPTTPTSTQTSTTNPASTQTNEPNGTAATANPQAPSNSLTTPEFTIAAIIITVAVVTALAIVVATRKAGKKSLPPPPP